MRRKNENERQIRLPESYLEKRQQEGAGQTPWKISRKEKKAAKKAEKAEKKAEKKNKQRRRHPVVFAAVSVLLCVLVVGCLSLASYLNYSTRNDFLWLDLEQLPYRDATILYAQDAAGEWQEYTRLSATQQKIWVPLSEIPEDLQHAFVAVEDKNFYRHFGVSIKRTVYAVLNEVKRMLTGSYFGGGIKQGASTIDQQLIKNLTRDDDAGGLDGYMRKVRELWRAIQMDAKYDKDTIMEAYLNVISFTDNTAGVEAESIKLFGKSAKDLTLEQCASIASITKNPAHYDPRKHPEEHLARRNYILYEMWQQEYITEQQYLDASAQPIGLAPGTLEHNEPEITSYFTDQVLQEVSQQLSEAYGLDKAQTTNLLYNGGLRIYTTVDTGLQADMERTMEKSYTSFFPTYGLGVRTKATRYLPSGAVARDEQGNPIMDDVVEMPQAAMVSVGYDGSLRAVVGGLGEKEVSRGLNRGMVPRQVGSTMKPIGAYALALEQDKINWSSPILDAPVRQIEDEETGEMKDWPANFTKTYSQKEILVVDALAQSINTAAVRVGEMAGVGNIYNFMKNDLGLSHMTPDDKDAGPMILGSQTKGISPYELAGAYTMFGNGGKHSTLHSYVRVTQGSGREVLVPEIETEQVISPETAYIVNRMMAQVMRGNGTAAGYSVRGKMESVGKTGTSSDNRDFWFVGMTPYYVTATWYGYDSGFELNTSAGTHAPTAAWKYVMEQSQKNLPPLEFPACDGVVTAKYCTETGGLATPKCRRTAEGYYKQSALPQVCGKHAA